MPGRFCSAMTPEMPTMTPPFVIFGSAAVHKKMCANVFVRNSSSTVSVLVEVASPKATTPIALTRTSSRPCSFITRWTKSCALSGSLRSTTTWPGTSISEREAVTTVAPRRRSPSDTSRPMPPVPPATSTTLPFTSIASATPTDATTQMLGDTCRGMSCFRRSRRAPSCHGSHWALAPEDEPRQPDQRRARVHQKSPSQTCSMTCRVAMPSRTHRLLVVSFPGE